MIPLDDEQTARLKIYESLLKKWQRSINLVSDSTLDDAWQRHFIDSLQLATHIPQKNLTVIDVGSGGGFPGLVLAMVVEGNFHLIESDLKKCIFLKEVSRETKTNVTIHQCRIETVSMRCDIITSRALASVSQIFSWTQNLVSHETKFLLLKGKNFSNEIDEAKKDWHFDVVIHPSVTEKEAAILECHNILRRSR